MSFNFGNKLKSLLEFEKDFTKKTIIAFKVFNKLDKESNLLKTLKVNGSLLNYNNFLNKNEKSHKVKSLFSFVHEEITDSFLFKCYDIFIFKNCDYCLKVGFSGEYKSVFAIPKDIIIKEFSFKEKKDYSNYQKIFPKDNYEIEFLQFVVEKCDEIT